MKKLSDLAGLSAMSIVVGEDGTVTVCTADDLYTTAPGTLSAAAALALLVPGRKSSVSATKARAGVGADTTLDAMRKALRADGVLHTVVRYAMGRMTVRLLAGSAIVELSYACAAPFQHDAWLCVVDDMPLDGLISWGEDGAAVYAGGVKRQHTPEVYPDKAVDPLRGVESGAWQTVPGFARAVARAVVCAGAKSRYQLDGVYVDRDAVVTTDGNRLARIACSGLSEIRGVLLAAALVRALLPFSRDVSVGTSEPGNVWLSGSMGLKGIGDVEYLARSNYACDFPDYRQVVPVAPPLCGAVPDVSATKGAGTSVMLRPQDDGSATVTELRSGGVTVALADCAWPCGREGGTLILDAAYLRDARKVLGEGPLVWRMGRQDLSPVVIMRDGAGAMYDGDFYVVVPKRVD